MKILLDLQAIQSQSRHRGIGNYTRGMADAMLRRNEAHEFHILLSGSMSETLEDARRWAVDRVDAKRIHIMSNIGNIRGLDVANNSRAAASRILYDCYLQGRRFDLCHSASPFDGFGDDTAVGWSGSNVGCSRTATLYDLIPFQNPEVHLTNIVARDWFYRRLDGLARADAVLAISEYTRSIAAEFLPEFQGEVFAVGADVGDIFAPRDLSPAARQALLSRYSIKKQFVLHVGILEKRKNVEGLIAAFARIDRGIAENFQIVLIADATLEQKQELMEAARAQGLPSDALVFTNYISDGDLVGLYNLARCTVMPSMAEGFGLPLLEAMRCGCAVLGSNRTSIPEVVGSSDFLFDPLDIDDFARSLGLVLGDEEFWKAARGHALRQAKNFSWQKTADRSLAAFEAILERRIRTSESPKGKMLVAKGRQAVNNTAAGAHRAVRISEVLKDGWSSESFDRPVVAIVDEGFNLQSFPALAYRYYTDGYSLTEAAEGGPDLPLCFHPNVIAAIFPRMIDGTSTFLVRVYDEQTYGGADLFPFEDLDDAVAFAYAAHPVGVVFPAIEALSQLNGLHSADVGDIAVALAENCSPVRAQKRLLVDITHQSRFDAKSGIQRVVRNILRALIGNSTGYRIEPIRRDGDVYRYARRYTSEMVYGRAAELSDGVVDFYPDDTFLGLDLDATISPAATALLQRHHLRGMRVVFVVYDLLPMLRPDWFLPGMSNAFQLWFGALLKICDGLACISDATADDVREAFALRRSKGDRNIAIEFFHLGSDLDSETQEEVHSAVDGMKTEHGCARVFLTVGTIEPRKGISQLLDAAERLWAMGENVGFILVGKKGWCVDQLIERIEGHQELGKRLVWLSSASDGVLQWLYKQCDAAVLPSEGEGFGLPLIEAARHNLPIVVRDLPVFREIAGEGAFYFSAGDGRQLAMALAEWLLLRSSDSVPSPKKVKHLSWPESASELMRVVNSVVHST